MDRYSMVVSRGYVRLVREAGPGTRPKWPHRLADLVHWEDLADQDDNNDDWQGEALDGEFDDFYLSRYGNPSKWGGDLEDDDYPVPDDDDEYLIPDEELEDRMVEMAIAAAKGGRGDSGLSNRSRMNMRRLFLSLPWELCGPRPALISLTYPADWVRWVPDGRTWERHRKSFERRWVRRRASPSSGCGSRSSRAPGARTCTSTSAYQRRCRLRTSPVCGSGRCSVTGWSGYWHLRGTQARTAHWWRPRGRVRPVAPSGVVGGGRDETIRAGVDLVPLRAGRRPPC